MSIEHFVHPKDGSTYRGQRTYRRSKDFTPFHVPSVSVSRLSIPQPTWVRHTKEKGRPGGAALVDQPVRYLARARISLN